LETALSGVEVAREAGLEAEPRELRAGGTTVEALIACAEEIQAGIILVGSRGRSRTRSILLGSVAHALIQRALRPVVVVPSPELRGRRERVAALSEETEAPGAA
jgi:nucleotide-binding universal stress UspA family protein